MRPARAALRAATTLAVLAALVVPSVAAHGPPPVRDHETRMLADHNDDCGGDDAGSLGRCSGTHDLVGLDLREAHDGALGDHVVFRFLLNGGSPTASSPLRDVLSLKAGGEAKAFELRTTDNQAFTGTGFDRVGTPQSLGDGARFALEAAVRLEALGGAGTQLTELRVESFRGNTKGDVMPGTYHTVTGPAPTGSSEQSDPQNYVRPSYTLAGPVQYAAVTVPAAVHVPASGIAVVKVELGNKLRNTPQTLTLEVTAEGAEATVDGKARTTRDLPGAGKATVEVEVRADAGATGVLRVTVSSNLGGHSVHSVPVTADAAPTTDAGPPQSEGNDAPAPAGAVLLAALAAVASARRRA